MREDLIYSERKDSIYYGDLFRVAGQGCLFFGSGKSKAGMTASDSIEENDLARDFVCITRDEDTVYGHFEMEFRASAVPDPIHKRTEIHYMVRMLNEKETEHIFGTVLEGAALAVLPTNYETFIRASEFNITFGAAMAPGIADMFGHSSPRFTPEKAMENFVLLTQNSDIRKFLFVPWMETHQAKGKLLKEYIEKDNSYPITP